MPNFAPLVVACLECGKSFDLTANDQAAEYAYGHDCEAPNDSAEFVSKTRRSRRQRALAKANADG